MLNTKDSTSNKKAIILVTGMSGTGKSTVLVELARRGYRVIDTDYDGWSENPDGPGGCGARIALKHCSMNMPKVLYLFQVLYQIK